MHIKKIFPIFLGFGFLFAMVHTSTLASQPTAPSALTYYVSSSSGNDNNNGLSESQPFETVSKVNSLILQPGDQVLFKCGDIWRADPLVITQSGVLEQPITFRSYPDNCTNQPILSGAQPITGWKLHQGNIYVAELNAGGNAGKFPYGVNQLFRGEERLLLGRWPNLDAPDGGYSTIDAFPSADRITDNEIPVANWAGAVVHIKGMRWYILNRQVTSNSGRTLMLGANADCWGGSCVGWGFFLNNHLGTLDKDGEWFYDATEQKVYLYSITGAPANQEIEGSVILTDDDRSWGAVTLGEDLWDPIAYVNVENFAIKRWFRHGIATPTNLHPTENHDVTLKDNTITDVDGIGINLAAWVWDANDGRPDGWRGGFNHLVENNTILRANRMGINTYTRNSNFKDNMIQEVGMIENLGAAGMGCSLSDGGGQCTEDGAGIRIKVDKAADSGNHNTLTGNRLEYIAHNGLDVFGYSNTFEHNVILHPCYAKGDCGGVRTFGSDSLTASNVHDLVFTENIIIDTLGNTDGCRTEYDALFGFGLYIDHYSRDIALEGNTVISSTVHGILFQDSTGAVTNNTLYNNGSTYPYAAGQVYIGSSPAYVGTHTGNILFSINTDARTFAASGLSRLGTSDHNYFFSPYRANHIAVNGDKSLITWQTFSGEDANSVEHWYIQPLGEAPLSRIFYNDSPVQKTFNLGNTLYKNLDQNPVMGTLTLQPYQSQILIKTGEGADLAIALHLLSAADTLPGDPLTYTITVANQGVITASQVILEHPIPEEIENTSWQVSAGSVMLQSGTRYTWEIDALVPGEFYTFTVFGQYSSTLPAGTPLLVTAEASTPSPDVNLRNNWDVLLLGDWEQTFLPIISR